MDSDDSADDDRCEMCGVDPTTRASNLTKRTLMTNAPTGQRCGHRFCGACVERVDVSVRSPVDRALIE